jgi:hypothetical protein
MEERGDWQQRSDDMALLSRTAFEWPRVGLRVSDRAGKAKRNYALERRR